MLTLKKTAVAVLALGSSAVFAGSMGPVCTPGNVTVPCAHTAWDFGAQALYLDAGTGSGDYAGYYNTANGTTTALKPNNSWAWGFQIEGSYHFNTGNDVNLNWYHIDRSKSEFTTIAAGDFFIDSSDAGYRWNSGLSANGSRNWDAVNLEMGQLVNFGENINTRFHGGLGYVHLKSAATLSGWVASNHAGTAIARAGVVNENLTYNGVGPRIGSESFYDWNNGFAVYAKGAMALFAGQSKFNGNANQGIVRAGANTIYSLSGSTTQVVPELEGKLGGTYTYAMAQGDLSVDLGWMWINYFNALNDISTASNFNLQGPYVGLKWVGNVA
jgi:hypothetical protein